MKRRLMQIPAKISGRATRSSEPCVTCHAVWSLVSCVVGLVAIYLVSNWAGQALMIGSFGSSAALLFGVPDSPLARPRNLVCGHLIAAVVAVAMVLLFGTGPWSAALAVGFATMFMNLTRNNHPPAGATAFIGVQGAAGPLFVVVPVLAGALILLLVALFTNNVVYHRHYPLFESHR